MTDFNETNARQLASKMDTESDAASDLAFQETRDYLRSRGKKFSDLFQHHALNAEELVRMQGLVDRAVSEQSSAQKSFEKVSRQLETTNKDLNKYKGICYEKEPDREWREMKQALKAAAIGCALGLIIGWRPSPPAPKEDVAAKVEQPKPQAAAVKAKYLTVKTKAVNMRSTPSGSGAVTEILDHNSCVELIRRPAEQLDWFEVKYAHETGVSGTGFVHASTVAVRDTQGDDFSCRSVPAPR